ncbi:Lipase maturation factor 1 [Anabarilius grahami]|uniref:Lipase maturation factor 1 n=1 Tax=Anabarilius grahami TaxID=495550 RepID=A0A3N0XUC6_ANAGA|nr:Lipase maturation factor 1 [Anabarilius grahami]
MASSTESPENSESFLRKRRGDPLVSDSLSHDSCSETAQDEDSTKYDKKVGVSSQTGTYWLTRILLLRAIALIYFVAFAVAYNQNKQLIGEKGLMPCKDYLRSVKRYVGGKIGIAALAYSPSVLWFMDWSDMDANLDGIALAGMALSGYSFGVKPLVLKRSQASPPSVHIHELSALKIRLEFAAAIA